MSACQAKGWPDHNSDHHGQVRARTFEVCTQPPGHGSFTLRATADLCYGHYRQFADYGAYVHIEFVSREGAQETISGQENR